MKTKLVLFAVCLVSVGLTQWLERTVRLPDSLGGLRYPRAFCVNTGNNTVFVGGEGDRVLVLDGVTNRRIAAAGVPGGVDRMCYNPTENRVYCINGTRPYLYVLDAAAATLADSVYVGDNLTDVCYVPGVNKVYCSCDGDTTYGSVTAVDCGADTVTGRAFVWSYYDLRLCAAPEANKVYCGFWQSSEHGMAVIDCSTDTVVGSVAFVDVSISDIAYNPVANKLYVAWGGFGEVIVVDCATDSVLNWTTIGEGEGLLAVDTTDNKVYVSCRDVEQICVISGVTNEVTTVIPVGQPGALAWDGAENLLLCVDEDRVGLAVFDCRADTTIGFAAAPGGLGSLCWNPAAGRALALAGSDVLVFEPSPPELVTRVPMWFDIRRLCMDPDHNLLYAAGPAGVAVIAVPSNHVRAYVGMPAEPLDLAYNPARRKLYCACDGAVAVVDCQGDSLLAVIPTLPGMNKLCYNPVDDKIYAAGSYGPAIIDCAGDSLIVPGLFSYVGPMAFSEASDRLFCDLYDSIGIVDGQADTVIDYVRVADDEHVFCYVRDGDLLASANPNDMTIDLIDCASGWVYSSAQLYYEPYLLGYSRLSRKLYSFERTGGHVTILNVPSLTVVGEMWMAGTVTTCDYDSLSDRLACGLALPAPAVRYIDCRLDSFVAHVPVPGQPVSSAQGPGRRLYVAHRDSSSYSVIRDSSLVALDEAGAAGIIGREPLPTIVRGVLTMGDREPETGDRAALLDIAGRKVMALRAGANDVSRLAPGVYFVREEGRGAGDEGSGRMRKVIIQR